MKKGDRMEKEKFAPAVEMGKRGGIKGGKARAANMTPEERSEAARKASNARWGKKDKKTLDKA